MNIAILEKYPLIRSYLERNLESRIYKDEICITNEEECADIILSDEKYFSGYNFDSTKIVIAPSDSYIPKSESLKSLYLCGMHNCDAVTLSSIKEDHAMLCLQREVDFFQMKVLPFESWIGFDPNFDIFKNISVGFIITLLDLYFGEGEWKELI